ncbi:hypothetical protein O181_078956 [Austropuccinia psidii MF-1]|uniref:Uncharacterized protein n=1 Tax=Austropuccinia psidii MF-1 TaxID=1389203 RepID=A0A9Q3FKZ1_9BASI|nr:hypothetical protein [Austropuccinia psidii MF-1]
MHRVDEEIEKSSTNEGKQSQAHICIESETSKPTAFGRVPKGLPIDFFDPEWFNNSSLAQKTSCANIMSIAFLPDKLQSIRGKQHPEKKLGDKQFSQKYWEEETQDYDLSHKPAGEDDEDHESSSHSENFDSDSSLDSENSLSQDNDYEEEKLMKMK